MSMAARRGKPKIRPPRKLGPDTSIKDTWTKLANAIREIQNHNASKLSFEEHYRYAYNMVLHKHGDQLYNGVKGLIAEHLDQLARDTIVPTFPRTSGSSSRGAEAIERAMEGDRFLKAVKGVWDDHTGSMRKLKDVLKYMDRSYTTSAGVPDIYEVGLTLFLQHIVRATPIHTHLIATLLSQVQLERDGETITRSTVRECVDILLRLSINDSNVYLADFEPEFLRRSADFYKLEAVTMLEKGDSALYLRNVERRLIEEADRTAHYLSSMTTNPLQDLLVEQLLSPHLSAILDASTGLTSMVDTEKVGDLRRLYTLLLRVPENIGRDALRLALRIDIEERGKAVNQSATETPDNDEDPKGKGKAKESNALSSALRWVQDTLDLKDKFDQLLAQAFGNDLSVQTSINEAFQSFINATPRAPEFLSLFIDEHLKKGTKAKTEDEIDQALEKTIILFRFLHDKDKFERYYKNHLARRMLYGRSASDDAEKGMVAKLKVEMGFQFTQKLEGMFTDMRISSEGATTFRNYLNRHGALPFDLSVNVLTASYWPQAIAAASTCTFNSTLAVATSTFQRYYDSRHSGRRLTWQGNLGHADVRVRFKARTHDLNVSTQALVVLLLFEDVDELSYEDIQAGSGLADAELGRTLQSLACGKFRILLKTPKGREVNPGDIFAFNDGFTCPLAKIKIMQVASKVESPREREETQVQVDEERKHVVEVSRLRRTR
ncbi:Cullin [Kockovaella imperatae]|uniref:Cullin n=1 Tax=Kockovaella imperatae TaxID=4999 RepID=A0A1Y1UQX8_9TREE|nr:Cullin [Kockovaella imperatae]ORX40451.1 Cullin [Kockovaella imperatae]